MSGRSRSAMLIALCLVATAGSSGALAQSPSAGPLTLTLAIANDQGEPSQPAIDAFIEQVANQSDGSIVIDPLYGAGNATEEGFEAGVAGLVERGDADLGLIASRAWDLEGVTSLQALQAPFLITDGALAVAVATSDIATRALAGMADKGVTGLTLWPEDLRHPFALGAHAPFLTPEDFQGANILVQPSALSRSLITTLGGTLYVDGDREADAAAGILQGAESGLLQGATLPGHPTATGDVTFYPKFQVISANSATFDALTGDQQAILRSAAAETQRLTIAAHTSEADAAAAWCANGGTVVLAGPDGVAAFEAASKPVFDAIGKDPLTATLIADIQALKATTTPAPGATACNAVVASPTPVPSQVAAGPSPVTFLWSGVGAADGMRFPGSMAIDPQGRVWVADTGNDRFAVFSPDGAFVEYWGSPGSGDGQFKLRRSNGDGYGAIAFAPDGSFYVLDVGNRRVQHFDQGRGFLGSWGGFGTDPGKFNDPIGLAVDATGTVYVLDDVRDVIERYDADGTVLGSVKAHPDTSAGFNTANSLSLDSAGNLYVSDCCGAGNQVKELDPTGALVSTVGGPGAGPGHFSDQPGGISVDAAGRVFVTQGPSGTGDRIQVFAPDGTYLSGFGSEGSGDGQFGFATNIVLDGQGSVYVADAGANRIEKFQLLPPLGPEASLPPNGTYQALVTATEMEALGAQRNDAVNNSGLVTLVFHDGTGTMNNGKGEPPCGITLKVHATVVTLEPDGSGGCGSTESYDLRWTLAGDELGLSLVTARLGGKEDASVSTFGKALFERAWKRVQ